MSDKQIMYAAFWLIIALVNLVIYAMGANTGAFVIGSLIMSKLFTMEAQK